ncbi:feruloyl esterase-like protein [Trametes cingulata]|nr:feruloyl esterase-like protein [Trametes cingulata]
MQQALSLLSGLLVGIGLRAAHGSQSICEHFALRNVPGVALAGTTYYPANATVDIGNDYMAINSSALPAFCRVQLLVTTNETAGSSANTEVWLPDEWNGRMLTIGNGGFAGGADVLGLGNQAVSQGFAGVSTNTGHNSSAVAAEWAGPHNDNALIDFGWRAVHLSVLAGKEVTKQYYNKVPKRSYYLGCSMGGRQGLKEIQEFPDSFDGVVVGDPANWMSRTMTWNTHLSLNVMPRNSSRFIPLEVWRNVIKPEVMRQCDALDGVTDGIINDPRLCDFQPELLRCRPKQDPSTCLNADQIQVLRRVYADYYETDQTYVFGGLNPGGEDEYYGSYLNGAPLPAATPWIRYVVLNDTEWTPDQWDSNLFKIADEINAGQANAINPNLIPFGGPPHDGKLLHFVGLVDERISPRNSFHYYQTVLEHTLGNSMLNIDDFYRLFPAPGVKHCFGGPGANAFGSLFHPPSLSPGPEHNILSAMIRWVEEGVAPTQIVAAKYKNDNPSEGVAFTRPLCKWPTTVKYLGGDPNDAGSFICS